MIGRIERMTNNISTGGDVASYCTKCRLTLEHVVVAMVGGSVAKVKCKTCGSIHRLRESSAARAGGAKKKEPSPKSLVPPEALWESALRSARGPEQPYDMTCSYRAGDVIIHSVFGRGILQKVFPGKCSVLFRDKERLLATANR
jgi:hypothetical protein